MHRQKTQEIPTPLRPQARAERNRRLAVALSAEQLANRLGMTSVFADLRYIFYLIS